MKTLFVNRNVIVSIFAVMFLIHGVPGICYGQGTAPTLTPYDDNTSLRIRFRITLDEGVDRNAYQVQFRQKRPQGEWISKCVVIERGNRTEIAGDLDVFASAVYYPGYFALFVVWHPGHYSDDTFYIDAIFTNLDFGTAYEARYRDTNLPECAQNPPTPDSWSELGEGTTYLVVPPPTFLPGENNTSLLVFSDYFTRPYEQKAYQVQLRRKSPQGEWITICTSIGSTVSGLGINIGHIRTIFTDLEPETAYEARYRDTNQSECAQNPFAPDPWSEIAEGTTHLVAPARADFVDANLAKIIRNKLQLDTEGGHIDLLKIPLASLAKLAAELELSDQQITDITGLEHATQLEELDLSYNQISDISPLAHLLELTNLILRRNQISDISPLAELPTLRWLSLSSNQISDVTPLTTFASVDSLRYLFLRGNPITDTSSVRKLKREHSNLSISIDIPVILTNPGDETDLYVIADRSILQVDLDRTNVQKISPQSLRTYSIAIDVISDKIYWASRDDIQRANLDGTHVQNVVTGLDEPENIALDVAGGKIYWTEERGHRIQRANLDGTNIQDVITGLYRPYGIALDIPGGKIYWMEEDDRRIRRANLDGTNVQDVVTGLNEPENIALDVAGGKIYWTESSEDRIQRANLDGSDVHVVVTDLDGPRGIALDISGDRIYWTDYSQNTIWRANLDGADVHVVAIGVSSPTAIALDSYHTGMQDEQSVSEPAERPPIPEDVNGDDVVNILDLVFVASALGDEGQGLVTDVNGDGVVNILDLVMVAGALGNAAAAPSADPRALAMLTATDVGQWLAQAGELDLADATSSQGLVFLKQLLAALTPADTALMPNYPNPFNPETWIPYRLAEDAGVTLTIYDTSGNMVRRLELGHQSAGFYESRSQAIHWDGRNEFGEGVASGVYFYHLSAGEYSAARRMLVIK